MQPVDTNRPGFLSVPRALPWAGIGARRWRLRPSAGCEFWGERHNFGLAFSQTDPLPKRKLAFGRAEAPVAANGFFIGAAEGIPFPLSSEVCRWLCAEQAPQ